MQSVEPSPFYLGNPRTLPHRRRGRATDQNLTQRGLGAPAEVTSGIASLSTGILLLQADRFNEGLSVFPPRTAVDHDVVIRKNPIRGEIGPISGP